MQIHHTTDIFFLSTGNSAVDISKHYIIEETINRTGYYYKSVYMLRKEMNIFHRNYAEMYSLGVNLQLLKVN